MSYPGFKKQWYVLSHTSLLKSGFPVAQLVKNLPAMQETPVQFLGHEHPLEKGEATHSVASLVAQTVENLPAVWETWV